MRHLALFLTCASGFCFAARPITQNDLYAFRWIADPRISPDGRQVAFTLATVTPKHDGYATSLWIVPAAGGTPRQITAGPRDTSPRWSPDGGTLAFTRAGEKDPAQIYLLNMQGGEPRPLTDLGKGASNPVWSPDGRTLAFLSTTEGKDQDGASDAKKADSKKEEDKSDVRVINRAVYRSNGSGYVDYARVNHIWTVAVPSMLEKPVKAKQITADSFDESAPLWSPNGSQLYFSSDRNAESYYEPPHSDIYSVSASGGEMHKLASVDGGTRALSLSPDGKRMAYIGALNGNPIKSYSQPDLWITTLEPGANPRNLTADYDFDIGGGIGGDQAPPRGTAPALPFWSADGNSVFVTSAEKGRGNLKQIDVRSGKVTAVTEGDWDVYGYTATPDHANIVAAISTTTSIGDLYSFGATGGKPTRLTDVNHELFSELDLPAPEELWVKSFDGRMIQTLVQKPPQFDPAKKYPAILNIHGGPHATYGFNFFHEMQWLAARGYVVIYPNPRGSTSFGQDFGNVIQYNYPGDDYKDLMAAVDAVIAKGWADPNRLGVTGGSGGGVLTNWIIGHTNRFKAAVSMRSIANWSDWWYTADFAQFRPTWFRGAPFEYEADFKAHSPITYIKQMNTPLMLIEGDQDYRTPPSAGGEQLFRALKYLKKPVVMVQFPGESHELSRSGKPKHRTERLDHIVSWFDIYLQNKPVKGYEVSE